MSKNKNIESIIYLAQCTLKRELIYVGKTHQKSLDLRIEQHKQSARSSTTKFHKALIDEGFNNWDWKILARCSQEEEIEEEDSKIGCVDDIAQILIEKEVTMVDLLSYFDNRYNSRTPPYRHCRHLLSLFAF